MLVDSTLPFQDGNVFQVDLISNPAESFEFASRYFSYNDAGNLVGRLAHARYTSLRHDGLYFYHRDTREQAGVDMHPGVAILWT
jgi:hypothetical protein